jgi:hypothetical protein
MWVENRLTLGFVVNQCICHYLLLWIIPLYLDDMHIYLCEYVILAVNNVNIFRPRLYS